MTNLRNFWKPLAVVVFTFACVILLASWDFKNAGNASPGGIDRQAVDTVPGKNENRDKKIRDLDDVLEELEGAQLSLDKELKLDMEKLKKELESIKKVDMAKMKADMERGLKELDMNKINAEIQASMAKIDWDKIKMEIEKVDFSKMEQEMKKMEEEMKKIGPELEKSMQKMKEIDFNHIEKEMQKMEEEMKKIGPEIENSLKNAKEGIEKAKEEIREYKNFVDGLAKDGLIDKEKEYKIQHADGALFINGKKQPESVYNKYKAFLDKHKKFTINKEADDFDIDMD